MTDFYKQIHQQIKVFVERLCEDLSADGLLNGIKEIDHVCYRIKYPDRYEPLKQEFSKIGTLLTEASVHGRLVATFKLNTPVEIDGGYRIDVVELPYPRPDKFYSEGLEHIEVIPINFTREVAYQYAAGLVKFHEISLEQIIANEKNSMLTN